MNKITKPLCHVLYQGSVHPAYDKDENGYYIKNIDEDRYHWVNANACEEADNVNHPNHYKVGGIETFDFIKAKLTKQQLEGYLMGNIIKYMSRYQYKNGIEDIKKAQRYINDLIEVLEG